jgi:DnaJ family protein B protein 12
VERNCTENDIKKAFKRLAIIIHPDKNLYPKSNEAFQKLNEAMDVLSD